jgi:hypothetical protein
MRVSASVPQEWFVMPAQAGIQYPPNDRLP